MTTNTRAVPQLNASIGGISIDAQIERQFYNSIGTVRGWRDAGLLGDVVVVHLGNNGYFRDSHFDQMMAVLSDVRLVVFVNLTVTQDWEGPTTSCLRRAPPATATRSWRTGMR